MFLRQSPENNATKILVFDKMLPEMFFNNSFVRKLSVELGKFSDLYKIDISINNFEEELQKNYVQEKL